MLKFYFLRHCRPDCSGGFCASLCTCTDQHRSRRRGSWSHCESHRRSWFASHSDPAGWSWGMHKCEFISWLRSNVDYFWWEMFLTRYLLQFTAYCDILMTFLLCLLFLYLWMIYNNLQFIFTCCLCPWGCCVSGVGSDDFPDSKQCQSFQIWSLGHHKSCWKSSR